MPEYGLKTTNASVAGTKSVDPDAGTTAGLFTWTEAQQHVRVYNHPDSAIDIYILWNDAASPTVATSKWNAVLEPGMEAWSPEGIAVKSVGIYLSGAGTAATNYSVYGWK